MSRVRLFLLLCLCALAPAQTHAVIITLTPSKDNTIYSGTVNNSNGGGAGLFAGTDGMGRVTRSLIAFDFSSVPAGAIITDVKLTLTLGMVAGGGGGGGGGGAEDATISLFTLTRGWGEGSAGNPSQNPAGIMGSGAGFAAGTGDATWSNAAFGSTPWTTAGGDHAVTASASLFLDNNTTGNSFAWLSTAQLVADVQGWVDHPTTNFGWELINTDEVTLRTAFIFYSRNWPAFASGSASQVPMLQITYTVPEPGVAAMLALGALLVPIRRRPHARQA